MVSATYPQQDMFKHLGDWEIAMSQHAASIAKDPDFPLFKAVAPFAAAVIARESHVNIPALQAAFSEYQRWCSLT